MTLTEFQVQNYSKLSVPHLIGEWKVYYEDDGVEAWRAGNKTIMGYHIRLNKDIATQQSFTDRDEFYRAMKKIIPCFEFPADEQSQYLVPVRIINN